MKKRNKKIYQCLNCGNTWVGKIENPKICPKCKQYEWNMTKEQKMESKIKRMRDRLK